MQLSRLESGGPPPVPRPLAPRPAAVPAGPAGSPSDAPEARGGRPVAPSDEVHVSAPFLEAPVVAPSPAVPPPSAPPVPAGPVAHVNGVAVHETASGALIMEESTLLAEDGGVILSMASTDADANSRPVDSVVVVGAGPAGLASAIRLAEKGLPVTVLEIRDAEYGRPHHLNLRQSTLQALGRLGVYDRVMERSGFIRREENLHTGEMRAPEPTFLARGKLGVNAHKLISSDSVTQVRIADVEQALFERAAELGVRVERGWQARLEPVPGGQDTGMYRVTAERVRREGEGFAPSGERRDLGVPGLVLVADGTNSATRESLGIGFREESEPTWFLGGHVNRNLGAITRKALHTEADGFRRKLMATGHNRYPQAWVSVQCRPETARAPREERVQELCEQATFLLGKTVRPEDIAWGAGLVTVVQNRRAEHTTAGLNVLLVGDSSRSGSVWASGGINLALGVDPDHVERLVDDVNSGVRTRSQAMASFDNKMRWATEAWHAAGEFEGEKPPAEG